MSSPVRDFSHLQTLFDHLPDAVYLIDPETSDIAWGNRAAWEMLGLTASEVLNHSVVSLQKDVHGMPQWAEIAQAIRGSDCFRFNGRHHHKDGHEVVVEVNTTHFEMDGRSWFLSAVRDVTNRVAQETDAQARERQLWFALNEAGDGLWDWEIGTGRLFFSPQLKRMLGYGPDEMSPVLDTWAGNVHPDDKTRVMANLQAHLAGKRERYEAEYRLRNRNGQYIWVHDRGRVCERDAEGEPVRVVGTVRNISDQKALESRLEQLARHDALTGLANRRDGMAFLETQMAMCQRLGQPLAVLFIDVDAFKSINDHWGHQAGDHVLQQVAAVLEAGVRSTDRICRWGGEEFVLIAPGTDAAGAAEVAEKLRQAVSTITLAQPQSVSVSVGVAVSNEQLATANDLLAAADAALYRAKQQGRNRVVVSI